MRTIPVPQTLFEQILGLCLTIALVAGAPSSAASGASVTVERGPVTATVSLSTDNIAIGDFLEITVEVRAVNQVEVLLPQFGQSLERFLFLTSYPRHALKRMGLQYTPSVTE